MGSVAVRAAGAADRPRVAQALSELWGPTVVAHGTSFDPADLPALIAERDGQLAGVLTYQVEGDGLEVVTINGVPRLTGAGSALLAAAEAHARRCGLRRLWLVTTNDNLDALRFYQRRGLRIVALAPGAVDASRRTLKPTIPVVGAYGIGIHDEITLERRW